MGIFVTRSDYLHKSLQVVNWGYYCKQRSKCSNNVKDINTHMDAYFYLGSSEGSKPSSEFVCQKPTLKFVTSMIR